MISIFRQFVPKNKRIVIDFTEINWDNMSQLPDTPIKHGSDSVVNGDEARRKL